MSPQAWGPPSVVDVEDVELVVEELDVVVVLSQEQFGKSGGGLPTATFKQMSASVDVTGGCPFKSQMHSGVQVVTPTAAFKMKRQSVETGPAPSEIGCPQSPWAARPFEYRPNTAASAAVR